MQWFLRNLDSFMFQTAPRLMFDITQNEDSDHPSVQIILYPSLGNYLLSVRLPLSIIPSWPIYLQTPQRMMLSQIVAGSRPGTRHLGKVGLIGRWMFDWSLIFFGISRFFPPLLILHGMNFKIPRIRVGLIYRGEEAEWKSCGRFNILLLRLLCLKCCCGRDDNSVNGSLSGFHLLLLCPLQAVVALMGVLLRWAWGVLGEGLMGRRGGWVLLGAGIILQIGMPATNHPITSLTSTATAFYCKAQPQSEETHLCNKNLCKAV